MEPSDQYLKSKRNLVLFSGLLLLSATVGLNIAPEHQSSPLLPIALTDVTYFDEVIVLLVMYFLFQSTLFWYAQNVGVRQLIHHKIDFYASMTIAGISLLSYVYPLAALLYEKYGTPWSSFWWSLVSAVVSVSAALMAMSHLVRGITRKAKRLRGEIEQNIVAALLLRGSAWYLVYNPKPPGRGKKITFLENEEIGEGRNQNESTWRVRNGLLEILNEEGKIFSRFAYDKEKGIFFHTNDEDTLSLRSQRIEPLAGR